MPELWLWSLLPQGLGRVAELFATKVAASSGKDAESLAAPSHGLELLELLAKAEVALNGCSNDD